MYNGKDNNMCALFVFIFYIRLTQKSKRYKLKKIVGHLFFKTGVPGRDDAGCQKY